MNRRNTKTDGLKNGWDLPAGERIPLTGRKQRLIRAYQLLVQTEDDSFVRKKDEVRTPPQTERPAPSVQEDSTWTPPQPEAVWASQPQMDESLWAPPQPEAIRASQPQMDDSLWAPQTVDEEADRRYDRNSMFKPPV